jgi:hypothetical protein
MCALTIVSLVTAACLGWWVGGELSPLYAIHASAMICAWGLLLPAGAVVARFFKVTRDQDFPRVLDNQFWWNWHRFLQYSGMALTMGGFAAARGAGTSGFSTTHAQIGLIVVALCFVQVFGGLLRGTKGGPTDKTLRGDHYVMSLRRRIFEFVHKFLGWTSLVVAQCALVTGAAIAGASDIALAVIGGLTAIIVLSPIHCAYSGRWIDTYVAIWGHAGPIRKVAAHLVVENSQAASELAKLPIEKS